MTPTLVFLHGISDGDLDGQWRSALEETLFSMGYPSLEGINVIAPRYANALDTTPSPSAKGHDRTTRKSSASEKRAFERERSRIEHTFRTHLGGGDARLSILHDRVSGAGWFDLPHARRYVQTEGLRNYILGEVLDKIPTHGELVIVGHSLGSLVAIDLLDNLPRGVHVKRLVTLGSPAGHPHMHRESERLLKQFPFHRVDSWINCWSPVDIVPLGAGVGSLFKQAVDLRVPVVGHSAGAYLRQEVVVRVLAERLFPRPSTDLVGPIGLPDIRLDDAETFLLVTLRYGRGLAEAITEDDTRERFTAALEITQFRVCDQLIAMRQERGEAIPGTLVKARDGKTPDVRAYESPEDAIAPLLAIAGGNVIAPFEIDVDEQLRRACMERLATALDCSPSLGRKVFDALVEARRACAPRSGWARWALGIGGLALLLGGPIGLVLAAPAGLAGGAAIVAALASFGPGGMIGGLITAGALTSTGMGAAAAALASSSTSAEATESAVVQQVAAAIARKSLGYGQNNDAWLALARLHSELIREHERLSVFSDPNATSLRVLAQKVDTVERALAYLVDNQLADCV